VAHEANSLKAGEQNEPSLKRNVSLFQAVMYGVGLILGAGIYVLIGDVAGIAGNAMWISFVISAVIATFTGLSYAELSSMFPKSAAEFVFVKNAFKNNMLAFVAGWLTTFVAIASAAAVAIGFSSYLTSFFPQLDPLFVAVVLVAALSAINFVGIRESMWMNTTFTIVELVGLGIVILAAIILGNFGSLNYYELPDDVSASISLSTASILAAAGLAFFAYFGFENLANLSEETKNATRNIPRALMISIACTTAIYIAISVSAVSLIGWQGLSSTDAPLAFATEKAFGKTGAVVLSGIALFATSNTVLMMLVSGSRIMFGMSKEGSLPDALGRVHSTTKTPGFAVIAMMILTTIIIVASGGSISAVANVAVFVIFIVYALVNFSLIWLRYNQPDLERPFKSPVTIRWFPILAGLGLATSLAMLTQFDVITMVAGAIAALTALAGYASIGRYKIKNRQGRERT